MTEPLATELLTTEPLTTEPLTDEWRQELDGLPFEELCRRLEETVATLERGELSLTDAERLYMQGMELSQRCQQLLSATELRISQIGDARGAAARGGAAVHDDDNPAADAAFFDDSDDYDDDDVDDDVPF